MANQSESGDLRVLAADFIGDVFRLLSKRRVIPRPSHMPIIRWGRHYAVAWIRELESYTPLEETLLSTFPAHFDHDSTQPGRTIEQPLTYMCRLIDASVALCTARMEPYTQLSPSVAECIELMLVQLRAEDHEFVCCRGASDLATSDGEPVRVGDVLVVPGDFNDQREIISRIGLSIAGAEAALREDWYYELPRDTALLFTDLRAHSTTYEFATLEAAELLRNFVLYLQLLHPTTCRSLFSVSGPTSLLSRVEPLYVPTERFIRLPPIRRTATVDKSAATIFGDIGSMLATVDTQRSSNPESANGGSRDGSGKILTSSWQIALRSFAQSHSEVFWHRNLVDLTTGLEAAMSDRDHATDSVTFRLQTRAAALLATECDTASAIYRDVGVLYGLRSKIAHGSDVDLRKFDKEVRKLSIASNQSSWLRDYDLVIDRLRDLLRRALLARLCLTSDGLDSWEFGKRFGIDERLSDHSERQKLRERWHTVMQDLGAPQAAEPAGEPSSRY